MALTPHSGAAGGPVGITASLHVCAATPNFLVMEGGQRRGDGLFREPLRLVGGVLELPTGSGLGIEIDPDTVAARTVDPEPLDRPMHRPAEDDSDADL